jgi:hypothetical protein
MDLQCAVFCSPSRNRRYRVLVPSYTTLNHPRHDKPTFITFKLTLILHFIWFHFDLERKKNASSTSVLTAFAPSRNCKWAINVAYHIYRVYSQFNFWWTCLSCFSFLVTLFPMERNTISNMTLHASSNFKYIYSTFCENSLCGRSSTPFHICCSKLMGRILVSIYSFKVVFIARIHVKLAVNICNIRTVFLA